MLKTFTKYNLLVAIALLLAGSFISSCDDDKESPGSQIQLNSFGPSPALRGGDIKFIGRNLDKVTSIILPGNVEVSDFKTQSSGLIEITLPEETMEGPVTLKTPNGDIVTKTILGISEPITITAFSPAQVRPGDLITITGTYLNLIETVVFSTEQEVSTFESQSKSTITLRVPGAAQTGKITVVAALEEPVEEDAIPIMVESKEELIVTLPAITSLAPGTVKAGTKLVIEGSNLDLVRQISFNGAEPVTKFELTEAGAIEVMVPANAQDGKVTVIAASSVGVESTEDLIMMLPTITEVAPNPVKPGNEITVTGTNLDLLTSVMFGGDKEGTISEGRTETSLTVVVPEDAMPGVVTFNTAANKSVESPSELTLIKPSINAGGVTPLQVKTSSDITITGENLDLVEAVEFTGGVAGVIKEDRTENMLHVTVPIGAASGAFTMVAKNGEKVISADALTVLPGNVPEVASIQPAAATVGQVVTFEGEKLDLTAEVIFPGGVKATSFGVKTATKLEVVVPEGAELGSGKVLFKTIDGEMSESPEFTVKGTYVAFIYTDSPQNGFERYDGWGGATFDAASTEKPLEGTASIKATYAGDWGGASQFGKGSLSTAGASKFAFSIFGGAGTNGKKVRVIVKTTGKEAFVEVPIVEGSWTDVAIPLSDLENPPTITELAFQDTGFSGVIYIDQIGLQ